MSSTDYGAQETGSPQTEETRAGAQGAPGRIPRARTAEPAPPLQEAPNAWFGWVVFAGCMMVMLGAFKMIWGLTALFNAGVYAVGPEGLVIGMDYTAWGWTMLIFGGVIALVGFALFTGATWARLSAVILVMLSAIGNIATLGAAPVWSTIMIVIDIIVIYAIVTHGRDMQRY